MKQIPKLIRKSLQCAFTIIAGLSTIVGLWGYTVKDINPNFPWWKWGLILFICFLFLTVLIHSILKKDEHKPYTTRINGKPVLIKVGDIFSEPGWKLIPFNERFDTDVDDHIIAHNTLNGKMIDYYVSDLDALRLRIANARQDSSCFTPTIINDRLIYPLGRLISYESFLMLSFSHFDENEIAYIDISEYEQLLIRMWNEMRRVYAAKHISLPLIGGGVTTIHGIQEKNYTNLLKCILCTLRNSRFQPDQGITIVLTQDAINQIDMNAIREEF